MTEQPVVDVILPVLNEVGALPWVLGRMPLGYRPIVVDNGSTDGSASCAESLGALVVTEPRRGFGAACWAGLMAATADTVAFLDADASLDPRELPTVCEDVIVGNADLVLGSRMSQRESFSWHARAANRYLARQVHTRTGVQLTDIGPMRAARRQALCELGMQDRGFGWPLEMVLRAGQARWRIEERDVTYRPRIGQSKVTGTVRGSARAARDMSRLLRAAS